MEAIVLLFLFLVLLVIGVPIAFSIGLAVLAVLLYSDISVLIFAQRIANAADSFALRNHGMKALLPGRFPSRAFSTAYARKDNTYALELAAELGVQPEGARLIDGIFSRAEAAGLTDNYFPVFHRLHDRD